MKFLLIRTSFLRQKWRWKLVARNGECICCSEVYHNKADAISSINLVRGMSSLVPIVEVSAR